MRIALHIDDLGMTAAGDERHEWRFQCGVLDIVRADMSQQVMHADQRNIFGESHRLGGRHADQQRADQSRSVGDADQIDLCKAHACLVQRLLQHTVDVFEMVSGGDLRHHTAVLLKNIDL